MDEPTTDLSKTFYLSQIIIGALFVLSAWILMRPKNKRRFKDEPKKPLSTRTQDEDALAHQKRNTPLQIEGISIHGEAHEILGISPSASEVEIHSAYKKLMRQYHPDQVARPDTSQWKEAQKIATALGEARDKMLASLKVQK